MGSIGLPVLSGRFLLALEEDEFAQPEPWPWAREELSGGPRDQRGTAWKTLVGPICGKDMTTKDGDLLEKESVFIFYRAFRHSIINHKHQLA